MHMADALLSPQVAGTMYGLSAIAAATAIGKLNKEELVLQEGFSKRLPQMAVMSAFVFAGQMVNFTIPGTGSSGHICGGMLLSAILGPFAGFISMIVILALQCLMFADGGLMALGANIWNMAFYGCFVGFYLIYRPIMKSKLNFGKEDKTASRIKIMLASILGSVITLQLGAFSVCIETLLSKITDLPFGAFVGLMQPIHLAIGLVEGIITGLVLIFVYENRPSLIKEVDSNETDKREKSLASIVIVLAVVVAVIGGGISLLASSNPDGLEWSLFGNEEAGYSANMGLDEDDYGNAGAVFDNMADIVDTTALLPDYSFRNNEDNPLGTSFSGVIGSALVAAIVAVICLLGGLVRKRTLINKGNNRD